MRIRFLDLVTDGVGVRDTRETDAVAFFLEDGQGVLDAIDGHSMIFGRHEAPEIGERIAAIGNEIFEGKTRLDEQSHLGAWRGGGDGRRRRRERERERERERMYIHNTYYEHENLVKRKMGHEI